LLDSTVVVEVKQQHVSYEAQNKPECRFQYSPELRCHRESISHRGGAPGNDVLAANQAR